jgi:hypothetical protein
MRHLLAPKSVAELVGLPEEDQNRIQRLSSWKAMRHWQSWLLLLLAGSLPIAVFLGGTFLLTLVFPELNETR